MIANPQYGTYVLVSRVRSVLKSAMASRGKKEKRRKEEEESE